MSCAQPAGVPPDVAERIAKLHSNDAVERGTAAYGLKIIGQIMALSGFVGLIVQPLWAMGKFFWTPGSMNKTKKERVYGTAGVIVAALAFFFLVPLPFSVKCTFELQPRHGAQVYTSQAGLIKDVSFRPGDHVQAGDKLMELENMDLKLELLDLEGRYEQAKQAVASLRLQRFDDPAAIDQIDVALEVQE